MVRYLAPVAVLGVPAGSEHLPGSLELRWLVAEAYERLAMPDSAASVFESIVSPRGLPEQQLQIRGIPYSFAHQRLVVLYARLGRLDDARRHWKIFSETFTTPDPELRHLVEEAREALLAAERRAG